ncbi:MAG: hypothetical protein CUN49_12675, partial [Candidatus Thermofonsia Clade 1 bacterium]
MTTQTDRLQGPPSERVLSLDPKQNVKGVSNFARSMQRLRKHRMALFGAALLLFVFLYVLIGSLLIPESVSIYNDPSRKLQPPSAEHPFGTDVIGRDILARTIYGGQVSLFIGVTA